MTFLSEKKLVFVAGLHRSGTTPLTRILTGYEDVSGFMNTGYPKDEGQFLQSVYPPAKEYGGPGLFAFKAEMHLTERSPLVNTENREKILREWSVYWDLSKQVLMEKSPPNLLKMRFLQELFPEAYFIVIIRHPVAVSYATRKWSGTTIIHLLKHWIKAHKIYKKDKKYIKKLLEVRYEDIVNNTDSIRLKIDSFLVRESKEYSGIEFEDHNKKYIELWNMELDRIWEKRDVIKLIRLWLLDLRIRKFGYNILKIKKNEKI